MRITVGKVYKSIRKRKNLGIKSKYIIKIITS